MRVEYTPEAIEQATRFIQDDPADPREVGTLTDPWIRERSEKGQRLRMDGVRLGEAAPECPRHGPRYAVRRGTNRCPLGRKRGVNCR